MVQAGTTVPTRNAEELAQREQARELGSGLVLAFYRLVKTAQLHALDNMAVHQQIEQTLDTIKLFQAKTGARMSILFAKSTVFVAGQLMKGSRGDYESALELGDMLGRFGFSELIVDHDVGTDDLKKLVAAYAAAAREGASKKLLARPSPNIRLRSVSPAVLAEDEAAQSEEEKIVRAYASAIVVMRRVFENLTARRYQLPHEAKRIAQKLVMLSEGDTPAFLGVTAMRNANHDSAGRAVNTSILAVSMARQLSTDLGVLAKVAMAALLYDVGGPYVLDLPERSDDQPLIIPRMMEDDAARLPAASALILTAMGQLHEASQIRSVIAYEAHWQRNQRILGTLYGGARNASVASRIVKTAHRFNELLTPDPGASKFATPDEAVTTLNAEAEDDVDRAIVALLVGAIGMFPTGSLVELTTGERGVVVSTPSHPADYARPIVRLVTSPAGTPMTPVDIDCVEDEQREVKQVLREADERLLQARQQVLAERGGEAAPQRRPRAKKQYGPGLETTAPPPKKWADSSPPGAPSPNDVATVPPKARPSHPAHGQRKPSRATPLIPREEVTDDELPVPTLPPEEKAAKSSTPSAPQSSPPDAAESAPPSSTPGAATSRPPRPLESQPPTVRRPTDAEASAPSDAPGSAPAGSTDASPTAGLRSHRFALAAPRRDPQGTRHAQHRVRHPRSPRRRTHRKRRAHQDAPRSLARLRAGQGAYRHGGAHRPQGRRARNLPGPRDPAASLEQGAHCAPGPALDRDGLRDGGRLQGWGVAGARQRRRGLARG